MSHQIQGDIRYFIVLGLAFVVHWHKTCMATPHDDICGNSNGRRFYLELGEHGILTAINVTSMRSSFPQQTSSSGNLSSHEQCSLELITCPACIVSITFHHLDLPHHCGGGNMLMDSPCRCDYVWLSEPPFEDVSGVPFCGILTSKSSAGNSLLTYHSQTRSLAITLLYSEIHKHAFTLEYTAERNRHVIKGSPGGGLVISPSSNMSHSGVLTSPFFPAQYPRDLGVEYAISCQSDNSSTCRVRTIFRDFQIAATSIMEFYDWNGHRIEVSSGALFRPPVILTTGPSLLVRFYANGGTGLGFKAVYSFITENFQESAVVPITDCGGYVENMGGAITMMNMVERGVKTYDCIWLIRPPKNYLHLRTHLYLKVATFRDMAGSTELQVIQGLISEQPILDTFRHPAAHTQSSRHREYVVPVNVGFYVSLRGTFGPVSRLAIVYTAFSYMDCFSGPDFLCQNHRCIPAQLSCDGFDHCGDNSDEPNTCYQEWEAEPQDRHWYSHTPNYYFPKIERYPDLKTATLVFVVSSLGLILLLIALILLLYRMGSRARQQRDIQNRLQTISELLDGARMDEPPPQDDPPVYEAPPDYDEVIKVFLEPIGSQRQKKKNSQLSRHSTRRRSSPRNTVRRGEVSVGSEQHCNPSASLLEVILPNPVTSSASSLLDLSNRLSPADTNIACQSCQATPIPDSPPPPYTDILVTPGPSTQVISPHISHTVSPQISSGSSATEKLNSSGSMLRQSWLLFRNESEEDPLLSVVVTGIAHPSDLQENNESFQSSLDPNMLPSNPISSYPSTSRQPLLENNDLLGPDFESDSDNIVSTSVVLVNKPNFQELLLSPSCQNNLLDSQWSPSIKLQKNCVYKGGIVQVEEMPRSLFSFDNLIAERINQTFPQFGQNKVIEPTTLKDRRCASHSLLYRTNYTKRNPKLKSIKVKDMKFRSHPQMICDLKLMLEMEKDKVRDLPNESPPHVDAPEETLLSNCGCEGACGCATVDKESQSEMVQRKNSHSRSLSADFTSISPTARSRDLRELDIYFSLHEFGLGNMKPIPSLTCDNTTDISNQEEYEQPPISPHKLWERPGRNLVSRSIDDPHCIL